MITVQKFNTQSYKKSTLKNNSEPSFRATIPKMYIALKEAEMNPAGREPQLVLLDIAVRFLGKFEKKLPPKNPIYTYILGERNIIPESLSKIDIDGWTLERFDDFLHAESPENLGCCLRDVLKNLNVENPESITITDKSFKNIQN